MRSSFSASNAVVFLRISVLFVVLNHLTQAATLCDINLPCPKNSFCNLDFPGAVCEPCPDELTCFQLGLPPKGAENCQSKCSKDNILLDCNVDSPCPKNEFCDLDCPGAVCKSCPDELTCFQLGLLPDGAENCRMKCSKDVDKDLDNTPQPIGGCVSNRSDGPVPEDIWSTTAIINDKEKYPPFQKYVSTRGIILAAADEISDAFLKKVTITLNQMVPDDKNDDKFNRSDQEDMMIAMAQKRTLIPVVRENFFQKFNNKERNQYQFLENIYSICDLIFETPDNLGSQTMEVVEHLLHFINMVGLHYLRFNEWGIDRNSTLHKELETSCEKNFLNYDGCESFGNNSDEADRILLQEYSYWLIATWMDLVAKYGPDDVENEWALFTPSLLKKKQRGAYDLCEDEVHELLAVPKNLEDYKFLEQPLTKSPTLEPTIRCDDRPEFFRKNKKGKKLNCKWIRRSRGRKRKQKLCRAKAKKRNRFWFYCPATCAKVNVGPCRKN